MKGILKIFLIIAISIFSIGAIPNSNKKEFNLLEEKLTKNNEFIENGVRVHYELPKDLNEYENIKNILLLELGNNLNEKEDSISYADETIKIFASFFYSKDTSFIQIDFINTKKESTTNEIQNKIEKMINRKAKKIKYFSYIKLKIKEDNKNYNNEIINNNLKDKEMINIENGKVGRAFLKDNTRVNLGYVKYNTGEYMIIGTPVIFVTY